ncbi:hypothetical protein H6F86_12020 [Phormidium sp. FACHB-592]|uniref:Uncharacterized protein n=1 Tax=Stenomitos frigidus AS-A4 TaxID=2933935 RepID=A0ABV0KS08_9CYAN|nr:hypothetical protein [Phormidium sp. FACHB-592]
MKQQVTGRTQLVLAIAPLNHHATVLTYPGAGTNLWSKSGRRPIRVI